MNVRFREMTDEELIAEEKRIMEQPESDRVKKGMEFLWNSIGVSRDDVVSGLKPVSDRGIVLMKSEVH